MQQQIHLLEKDQVIIDDVRFLGTTLWIDFAVEEPEHDANFAMWYAVDPCRISA